MTRFLMPGSMGTRCGVGAHMRDSWPAHPRVAELEALWAAGLGQHAAQARLPAQRRSKAAQRCSACGHPAWMGEQTASCSSQAGTHLDSARLSCTRRLASRLLQSSSRLATCCASAGDCAPRALRKHCSCSSAPRAAAAAASPPGPSSAARCWLSASNTRSRSCWASTSIAAQPLGLQGSAAGLLDQKKACSISSALACFGVGKSAPFDEGGFTNGDEKQ